MLDDDSYSTSSSICVYKCVHSTRSLQSCKNKNTVGVYNDNKMWKLALQITPSKNASGHHTKILQTVHIISKMNTQNLTHSLGPFFTWKQRYLRICVIFFIICSLSFSHPLVFVVGVVFFCLVLLWCNLTPRFLHLRYTQRTSVCLDKSFHRCSFSESTAADLGLSV